VAWPLAARSQTDVKRMGVIYPGRTLRGEHRGAALNLKTARALSLTIPHNLLARADELIE
jgi:hypothetical protein